MGTQSGNTFPGLAIHSPPNVAYTNTGVATLKGTPMLTVNYPSSNTTSFDLKSFYFGCTLFLANTAAASPTECLVEVTGYRGYDNQASNAQQACAQQFHFLPSTALGSQVQAFSGPVSSCFCDLSFVIVQFSLPGGTSAANADATLGIDDIAYTYRSCK